jgi:hypothetical protein
MIASKIGESISYIPAKSVGKQGGKFLMAALIKSYQYSLSGIK